MDNLYTTGLRPIIDSYLAGKAAQVYPSDRWRASSAGYCMRKVIFDRLGVPPTLVDERKTRVFEVGHIFHEWLQRVTKAAGVSIESEGLVTDDDLHLAGHFDDLIKIGDRLVLYDYKTAHSKSFHYAKGRDMSRFHRLQLGSYMMMLRKKYPELTEGRILKISKDDLCMAEDTLMWSAELEADVVAYWSELNRLWADKKLPACTCADHEGGFMSKKLYNPYYYEGESCSLVWYRKFQAEKAA